MQGVVSTRFPAQSGTMRKTWSCSWAWSMTCTPIWSPALATGTGARSICIDSIFWVKFEVWPAMWTVSPTCSSPAVISIAATFALPK